MDTVDRVHHLCLTVSSENYKEEWPKELDFFTSFLGMSSYRVPVEHMNTDEAIENMADGLAIGIQEPQVFDENGHPVLEYFYYLRGGDASQHATLIDLIVFLTKPGQNTQPLQNMNDQGFRSITLLVDNVNAIYQRGIDQGIEFITEPVTQNWSGLGEVRFVVVKDPIGNSVELVQTGEVAEPGDGKVLRIYSINKNTADLDKALEFYCDGCGMTVMERVEYEGEDFARSMGFDGSARATTCFLKGTNPEAKTYYALTFWDNPKTAPQVLKEGFTPSYYRMWLWVNGGSDGVQRLFDKMRPKMKVVTGEPRTFKAPPPPGVVSPWAFFWMMMMP